MRLELDQRQPAKQPIRFLEPSPLWMVGPVAVDGRSLARPALRPYSYQSECECPDDCLRDHENE